eukprot:TRINITY_DN1229_c0_g2_i1.p2 TRINITY_DN1229_c0_g2~~TRINITY_DN1229_c0_g2_i1.p2  ORF type:complete len:435 (-),score=166.64 TRINITY_DN1229_c0_g2_i1:380-1684(-)
MKDFMFTCKIFLFGWLAAAAADYDYCQAPGPVQSVDTNGLTLKFVQVITRHGDRTPTMLLPNDDSVWWCNLTSLDLPDTNSDAAMPVPPRLYRKKYMANREELRGNCALGQLTAKGLGQHYTLGGQFRALYGPQGQNLLPEEYDPRLMYVRSTDVPRTLASAQANVWSLLPPNSPQNQSAIVDIHTMDNTYEDMWAIYSGCPRLSQLLAQLENSSAWAQENATLAPLVAEIQKALNTTTYPDWIGLFDNLFARKCHSVPYPDGITDETLEAIAGAANFYLNSAWLTPDIGRLIMGQLVADLLDNFDAFVSGQAPFRYVYYSGHDTTVGPLAASLGVYNKLWPPYASHMEFEFWQDVKGNYFVQVKYNDQVTTLPACGGVMCPWSTFRAFFASRAVFNTAKDCQAQEGVPVPADFIPSVLRRMAAKHSSDPRSWR